jgi:hypothetical protein
VAVFRFLYQVVVSYVLNEMFVFCFNCQAAVFCIRWLYPLSCIRWLYLISGVYVCPESGVRILNQVAASYFKPMYLAFRVSCGCILYPVGDGFILHPCIRCLLSVSCLRLLYPLFDDSILYQGALSCFMCRLLNPDSLTRSREEEQDGYHVLGGFILYKIDLFCILD